MTEDDDRNTQRALYARCYTIYNVYTHLARFLWATPSAAAIALITPNRNNGSHPQISPVIACHVRRRRKVRDRSGLRLKVEGAMRADGGRGLDYDDARGRASRLAFSGAVAN